MGSLHRMAVVCGLTVLLTGTACAETWETAKDENGIKVSLSEVAGSKYKAYQGVTTIKASVAKIRALQEDVAGACSWIHECKSQKLVDKKGDESWTYTQFKAPFPVTDRDSYLHITTTQAADGTLTRKLEGVPTYKPEEKGYVRVAQVAGFWKLVPKGDNLTEVTYQVHTEPGGSVPSWLANKFVVDAPYNTLQALKEHAEKP
ncbi:MULTISPECIES: START domain-containing protein [Pseudomonas]|uniref:START domain-containing protein n=1 Tax=Pseudomonas TaxID=286 RepID=UPI0015A09271|nr:MULTISPECIES: START domain-containing protein [Pseudomonas]NVZ62624.1 START domain-containing protein [Pseudomonas gingeri]NVZ74266.1 START domain-containing protein [Pseudomonas gingeri]NWA09711.1 START domain-containing protein [Pseudomonas gingeri]NWE44429.1 START domain-containing protein [Pseudomonas gingeri]NWE68339.1 START domain-containing protein [Pseudomonas gingeri]